MGSELLLPLYPRHSVVTGRSRPPVPGSHAECHPAATSIPSHSWHPQHRLCKGHHTRSMRHPLPDHLFLSNTHSHPFQPNQHHTEPSCSASQLPRLGIDLLHSSCGMFCSEKASITEITSVAFERDTSSIRKSVDFQRAHKGFRSHVYEERL